MEIKLNVTLDASPNLLSAINSIAIAIAGGKMLETQAKMLETPTSTTAKRSTKQTTAETTVLTELPPASEPAPKVAPQLQDQVDTTTTAPKAGGMLGVVNFDTMRAEAKTKAQKAMQDGKVSTDILKAMCAKVGAKGIGTIPDDKIGGFILDLDEAIANG